LAHGIENVENVEYIRGYRGERFFLKQKKINFGEI
jgi:hypothetical protein